MNSKITDLCQTCSKKDKCKHYNQVKSPVSITYLCVDYEEISPVELVSKDT